MHQESLENAPELERELLEGQRLRLLSELLTEPKEKRTLASPSRKLHGLLKVPLGDLWHEVFIIIHIRVNIHVVVCCFFFDFLKCKFM